MKIDDILKKCIEIPGISIKSSETSTELLFKSASGKGSMTFYSLFPGFNLAYVFVNSPIWPAPDFHENGSNATGPLLFNYCVTGRCEIVLNNGNYVYLKDNDLSFTEINISIPDTFMKGWNFLLILQRSQMKTHGCCGSLALTFIKL